jgi:hypothetical protein
VGHQPGRRTQADLPTASVCPGAFGTIMATFADDGGKLSDQESDRVTVVIGAGRGLGRLHALTLARSAGVVDESFCQWESSNVDNKRSLFMQEVGC